MATPNDDYDTPWKDAVTRYFAEFMAFYFPRAHAEIDWSCPHRFLEQALAQVDDVSAGTTRARVLGARQDGKELDHGIYDIV